jgi:hypothetical protein
MTDIDKGIGVSEATGSAKSTAIRKLVDLAPFDPDWFLPSRMEENPMAWMVTINGLMVDARSLPREAQEQLYAAGLIPFLPAPRPAKG